MRVPYLRRLGAAAAVALIAASALAAPARPDRKPAQRPTLDDLTASTEMERLPDGSYQWKRTFTRAVPWDEYVAALAAEGEWEYDFTGERPVMRRKDPSGSSALIFDPTAEAPDPSGTFDDVSSATSAATSCVPPDDDYDGDSWTLATNPQDVFPLRFGEYVADRPRVVANFTSYIEPGIDVHYNSTNIDRFEAERFFQTDLLEKLTVSETREIKKKFNSTLGFKWVVARAAKPVIQLDLNIGASYERSYEYKWTREKTRSVEEKFTSIRKQSQENTVTIGPSAGRVSGQVTMTNLSDYAIDIDISNIRIAVVAYSPFTGDKYALGDVALSSAFTLGYGSGNNAASAFVLLSSLNSLDMMNRLAEGWVFDMEMASYTAVQNGTGTSLSAIISRVNQRTSRLSIHFGDATPRVFGQVSVFQPASACLTGKDMLTQFAGADNVEFDRMADGTLVVKRIFHRTNMFADRDFDTLTPAEQAQYGRWVVGFDYYSRPDLDFDLETTLLTPEDKVYFYFVTAADFVEPPPPPDENNGVGVANDGTAPASAMVTDVSTFDTVELHIGSDFQIASAYSQYVDDIYFAGCGFIYNATYYGQRVTTDSSIHNVSVPNVDWYGLQVNFGGRGWQPLANILSDPAAQASVTQMRGYPDYDYTLRFLVTPAMLAGYPTSSLQVRSANPRQTFSVGYEGWNLLGQRVSCRWPVTTGFYHNAGELKVWYKLDNVDGDLDGFYAVASTGIDFDDANARRFPYAPEHLDGIDNDGDAAVDEDPMVCPASLKAYDAGTCSLDNRMGWYPVSPNTLIERRFGRSDGTFTGWETVGSGLTSWSFVMTSDPSVTKMEVRTTFYPPSGSARSGVNVVYRAAGGDVPIFNVGPEFEAEAGRIVAPMRIDATGPDTFVHTPIGSTGLASASADYRINVTATGDYYIWTRVAATSDGDDSFLVTLYDSLGRPVEFGYGSQAHFRLERCNPSYGYNGFGWTRVGHWNPYVSPAQNMNPIMYHLNPGTYLVRIQPRELGTKLDKLRVERYCPDADGDGYSICQGDCNDANPNIRPGRAESCSNSVDDDCDGLVNEGCGGGGSTVYKKIVY